MPVLTIRQRQRERINARTWDSQQPYFLTYVRASQIFTRTYPVSSTPLNAPMDKFDPTPFGFTFNPTPQPPLVLLGFDASIESVFPPTLPPNPSPPPPSTSSYQTGDQTTLLPIFGQPVIASSFLVRQITYLAKSTNLGTMWVSSAYNSKPGVGFPVIAGASITFGELSASAPIDVSTIFLSTDTFGDMVSIAFTKW